jgi:two-component system cell cycle sensor histidine kinase/response regulator CckA
VDLMPLQTILLVDDDPLILELGRELLEHLGFRVATAGDATQALAVFQSLDRVDLAILDYHLAGEDGFQLFRALRALDAGVRVLIATGFLGKTEEARLKQGGVQAIIYKPFRLTELQQSIQAALAAGSGP